MLAMKAKAGSASVQGTKSGTAQVETPNQLS